MLGLRVKLEAGSTISEVNGLWLAQFGFETCIVRLCELSTIRKVSTATSMKKRLKSAWDVFSFSAYSLMSRAQRRRW
ncbi:hypothetical protein T01_1267 [Trichinella spiralis]|uniref:Uncharacterized protein n=1 Tax=Trichinella spiralis TaxID=6334 RepID=A0A0V1B1H6_TRISP|nr:hypothetical protein T01_1267 [Trichinella spiralis]